MDAPPTLWPLNNDAAFRAVLRTAPDDSKAEPSYHHGDAWQTSAPSLHCHLRRRFPRRCSTLPRVPRRSHEAAPRPSVGAPLTIISPYGIPCFQHGTAYGLSHKENYRPSCSIRHAQQATTASAKSAARRGRPAQKPRADRPRLLLTFRPNRPRPATSTRRPSMAAAILRVLLLPPLSHCTGKPEPVKDGKIFLA